VHIPSSSLVPDNDPTTLFTGSGMQPMMPYLLGAAHPLGTRLVDIQKCFRGQDIDEVGDNRHDSFFEMMGNWSLGDYFKTEQISWYFDFLTNNLGLPKGKLYVSVFGGDDGFDEDVEAIEIWKSLGFPDNHIYKYGAKKNWWSRSGTPNEMPIGEPGGPDSEVFYDFGSERKIHEHSRFAKEECHPNCDCGRFLEIGNNVFMTYLKTAEGFVPLSKKNIDFGGGFERTLAVLNDNPDMFLTDIYWPIISTLEEISEKKYGDDEKTDYSFRIVADHIKAATFLISSGLVPSNVDRGYILRRLIRRAIRFSKYLEVSENFIEKAVEPIIKIYETTYPDLIHEKESIQNVIVKEETKFRGTLEKGLHEFKRLAEKGEITGEEAFYLYESFGFPYEISQEEASTMGVKIDSKKAFEESLAKHKDKSRTASKGMFKGGLADQSEMVVKYHSATHLLQAALRKTLGNHVHQEGSNLTGERLRFDFAHSEKLKPEQISLVESWVNEQIKKGLVRSMATESYEEAIASGALAFFKERYPEKVTVYTFTDPLTQEIVSREICGGPHVETTNGIGKFKIIKEESVAAGIRRIYATLS
jgi:alanyl-tRNA synthetase